MAKTLLPFAFCILLPFFSFPQITVNQNDFANAGETVYLSSAQINPLLNLGNTGANRTWDFTNLRSSGQRQIDYLNVNNTNLIYALFYANIFFNPNRANIALKGSDIALNQVLGVTNPYTFYFKNNNMYKKVGYGGELLGLPVPIAMTTQDTIFRFPMNFNDVNSCFSSYSVSLPGVLTSVYSQTRNNRIDGWGTLLTPYGSFDVLRSKSEIFGSDSVYIDSLGFGIRIPRSKATEYKWIAKNEDAPVLQINTTTVFGIEIINLILFKDAPLFIVADSITGTLCPGASLNVHYTASGTFNPAAFLQQGNRFTVQLSNSTGSFASPVNIGNVTSTASGTISVTVPNNIAAGTDYRIRIISTSPVDTSATFGPFAIHPFPTATITANGATTLCDDETVELEAGSGTGFQFQWKFENDDINGAITSTYTASASGNYSVVLTNVCGSATSPALTVSHSPEPLHDVTPSATSSCDGSPVTITAVNISGSTPVTYQWISDGNILPGETDSMLITFVSSTYSLVVTNAHGCAYYSDSFFISIDSMPVPLIRANGNTSFCEGDSILLSADSNHLFSYQWQLNGIDISGATLHIIYANSSGDYAVVVSDSCDAAISETVSVMIHPLPEHHIISSSPSSCEGIPVTISAINTDDIPNLSYQWLKDDIPIPGENDSTLIAAATGNYSLEIADEIGCAFLTEDIFILFDSIATPSVYAQGNTAFCDDDSVLLWTDSSALYEYHWQLNGVEIPAENNHYIIVRQGGNYSVKIIAASGCNAASAIEKVSILPNPPAPVITQSHDTLISTEAASYQWYLNDTLITGAVSQFYLPAEDGAFTVIVSDNSGCSNISTTFVFTRTGISNAYNISRLIQVFPNPFTDRGFAVKSSLLIHAISVYDVAGALVDMKNFNMPVTNFRFDENSLPQGVYFLHVITEKGEARMKMMKMQAD